MRAPWVARLLLLALVWGASFLFIKVGLEGLAPVQVAAARVALGAGFLLLVLVTQGERVPRSRAVWGHLVVAGAVGNALPFTLLAWGEQHVSSVLAGIWNAATPLATALVATALLPAERLTRRRAAGLLVGFLGVIVVLGPWQGLEGGELTGQLACGGAALCYGVAFPYTRRFLSPLGYPPSVLAAGQLLCATGLLTVAVAVGARSVPSLPPRVVGAVVALGVLGSGLAYLLNYGLLRDVGATTTSTVTYLIPVVSTVLGVVVLSEHLGWNLPVGGLVVVSGVAIAEGALTRSRLRRPTPS